MTFRDIHRSLIFFFGDIRREHCPGGFAWGKFDRLIDYPEATEALSLVHPGDIGLHRNRGDFSNLAIKGMFKHAWIFPTQSEIIEAVSEGVLCRHPFHALMSDYVVILRPTVSPEAKKDACERASCLVGASYDDTFTFDLEIEESMFADKATTVANMRKYGLGVSCTETVALCYVGHRRELGIYRTKLGKRQVILPDAYMSTHWQVVWASQATKPEVAQKLGLHEEGVEMLRDWRTKA